MIPSDSVTTFYNLFLAPRDILQNVLNINCEKKRYLAHPSWQKIQYSFF